MTNPNCRILPLALGAGLALTGSTAAATTSICGLFEAVEPGDTLETVSQRCGVPVEVLIAANPGADTRAPDVASVLSLALPETPEVAGEPVSPGPRILQAPAPAEAPQAAGSAVLVVTAEPAVTVETSDIDARVLQPIMGNWVPAEGVCADTALVWTIEDERLSVGDDICAIENTVLVADGYVLEATCGGNGITVARDFDLRPLDALTMAFVTGDQTGILNRCAPD